jgi:hypothetical protein
MRLAAPLRAPTVEPLSVSNTPSKRASRQYEVADSSTSGRLDSLSPRRLTVSPHPCKRQATPEEMRRQSAPSRLLEIPNKANTQRRIQLRKQQQYNDDFGTINFKQENQVRPSSGSPALTWVEQALVELRADFPNAKIDFREENADVFECLDCVQGIKRRRSSS